MEYREVLNVELREQTGKGISRSLRMAGRIPADRVRKRDGSVPVSVGTKELSEAIAGEGGQNHILTLKGGGALDGASVIVADILQGPIKGTPRHVDLHKINLAEKVQGQRHGHPGREPRSAPRQEACRLRHARSRGRVPAEPDPRAHRRRRDRPYHRSFASTWATSAAACRREDP